MTTSNIATAINAAHDKVETAKREGTKYAMEAGRLLVEAKATVAHGAWDDWLKANVRFSPRTAQLYMKLARVAEGDPAKAQRVADLSLREATRSVAESRKPKQGLTADGRHKANLLIEAWREAGADTKREIVQEIHDRGDIDLSQYKGLIQAVDEESAAQRVVGWIHDKCGMEGIRRFDAALKVGCTPRMIALAMKAELAKRKA
ncbi:DUF3102 domain-containing protein [Lichenibacterium ramalinae]|uniref:DUF3102 domain-containing protein n=1 Tax=Lichenibacterium ramalinae TaxID=2316527 RepID=A0A4Q2RGP9_9HYPH|nr:DUF3102 domain-containing protein [Lichenibacterium ramalinae]RYB06233.1 DUF3102 domain-containing protein [Lichenibacterium ramalinae]